jgi:hypothetical protein
MRETNIFKVGDKNYEFQHVPVETAIEISVKLTKIISPLMAGGLDTQVTALVPLLKDALDPDELKWLIREILECTREEQNGKYAHLEMASFNGRIGRLYIVVAQGLIYNFSDFFDEIRPFAENVAKQFQARMKK